MWITNNLTGLKLLILKTDMTKYLLFLSFIFIFHKINAKSISDYLFPTPKHISINEGSLNQLNGFQYSSDKLFFLIETLENINVQGELKAFCTPIQYNTINYSLDSTLQHEQEYNISIDSLSIKVTAKNEAALFYAKQTLKQIVEYSKTTGSAIPCLKMKDWPDFERRGYMLDISRDKVPTMETLYNIIDLLASWKINEFQLYTEHTFAYKNHKEVWEGCSPMTAGEIQKLDAYCKVRFIDLVPNQNSFGHMENWLKHDSYLKLAECPTDCKTIWGMRSRTSLNPTNPGSLILMQELYKELLPNFTSKYFNIGCDETVELGCGLSKEKCDEIGKGQVYLNYLIQLNNEVKANGRKAQFWGDIILNHPELISSLPKDMTAMVWGYESDFPFNKKLPEFQKAGLQYYVCPGTSTWRSIIGRNHDAFLNLKNAAINGKKFDAKGYLNTNWGDYGHWQPLSVCYAPMAVGAAYSWNVNSNPESEIEFILNQYVFRDATKKTAQSVLRLGNAYLKCKIPEGNANAFHLMLRRYKWTMKGHYQTKELKIPNLEDAENEINLAIKDINQAKPQCADSSIIKKEILQASLLAKHGIKLGIARLKVSKNDTKNIDQKTKSVLQNDLEKIIENHKTTWILRNREGGLNSSSGKMMDLLNYYNEE